MFNILTFLLLTCLPAAVAQQAPAPVVVEGSTMGTTYRIIYFDGALHRDFSASIDSLLAAVNKGINTYDPDSEISKFNRSEKGICLTSVHLYRILKVAKKVHRLSDGAFDPTIMPLVNAWGFGPEDAQKVTQRTADSLRALVGFEKVRFSRRRLIKTKPGVQLDMGGIGQGYGADVIAAFLDSKGIEHLLVELGGEGVARGENLQKGKPWTIGVLNPDATPLRQFFKAYVRLHDRAFTTSGNYFNYRIVDGRKYGHTIDPKTGYPVQHSLLSASVFTDECAFADGWATAFMVMGAEKAIAAARKLSGVQVLLIYNNAAGEQVTYISPGLEENVILE